MDFAAPAAAAPDNWPHPMLERFAVSDRQAGVFYLAAGRLDDPRCIRYLGASDKRYQGRCLSPLVFAAPKRTD